VGPSLWLAIPSVCGCRWPPDIQWLLILKKLWATNKQTNNGPPAWQSGEQLTLLTIKTYYEMEQTD